MLAEDDRQATANGTSRSYANGKSQHRAQAGASSNGAHKSAAALNGSSKPRVPEKYLGHDREEVTRILIQALSDMGYQTAAESVSRDSGFELESPTVAAFRNAVLEGNWNEAEQLLSGATVAGDRTDQAGNGLVLANGADRNIMRFWIRQQKFLELLEERETGQALMVLRTELTPLYQDTQKLHFLSSLLMCQSREDLMARAEWDGAYGQSRQVLLSELSRCISPSVMLPEHRLAILLHQVKASQIGACLWHSSAASPSLYSDHICDRRHFPTENVLELDDHSDEVWHIAFSHDDGRSFITGSLDKSRGLVQWNLSGEKLFDWANNHRVEDLSVSPNGRWLVAMDDTHHVQIYNLQTRDMEYEMDLNIRVTSISISQDSRHLLVNHANGVAQLIDLVTREPVQSYTGHKGSDYYVIRSTFGGADESFVASGSEDGFIYIWHKASAQLVEKLNGHDPRVNSVAWSPTDPCLFASCGDDGKIKIWSNNQWRRTHMETMYRNHEASRSSNGS
ncbi:hypothetical protein DL770_006446 [Monosporascus sp. CRB-9-2]|nr:hypothetical protein DL770_006446 [Monosporascus sp. CRB-9-2]